LVDVIRPYTPAKIRARAVLKKRDGGNEGLRNPDQNPLFSNQFPGVSINETMPSIMKRESHAVMK